MTRTAVRRRVDVSDGRLVIRKVVVETSECLNAGPAGEPEVTDQRSEKLRKIRPGKYSVRIRQFHLL